ncbi:SDR family oxidoreductase [Nocardia callitridis]|uniref:SDR family oxidoreductase n=1 Tax=Nocardia callitridis TaxID=648753 RepID=A0ABP9KDU1_9NOCA
MLIGAGGMGQAIVRRIGAGSHLLVADLDQEVLHRVAEELRTEGHLVSTQTVDVSARESVSALARRATELGEVRSVVHTAGLSPVQASVQSILAVDLLGVALVLEEFSRVVARGGAGVVIASMAGHFHPGLPGAEALRLMTTPPDELLSVPSTNQDNFDPGSAYAFAKHVNRLQVRAASTSWGARGARINSISPGVIATTMGNAELASERGATMRRLIDDSNAGRIGTSTDIAAAAEFLLGPNASFISGTDLLVDGGAVAAQTSRNRPDTEGTVR